MNRPVLAQTFQQLSNGEKLTVAVNHLKSKGSACVGDPDIGDGQGNCNFTRLAAAQAEVAWLASDPTGSGDPDFLVIGDLNAYAMEDPIAAFIGSGFENLIAEHLGAAAYSYVFNGQSGYLDHALASSSLAEKSVAVSEWHINADEPVMLDYNQEFNPPFVYAPGPHRASEHDPVLVSFDLTPAPVVPTCNGQTATVYVASDGRIVGGPRAGSLYNGLLPGGLRANVIVGTAGNDIIHSGLAGDTICAGAGNDLVLGGLGDDAVFGEDGNDLLQGGLGKDVLFGGAGSDTLLGGPGSDRCDGGPDTDLQTFCEIRSNFQDELDPKVQQAFDRMKVAYDAVPGDSIPRPPAGWSGIEPRAEHAETPFGQLFFVVRRETDEAQAGSLAALLLSVADALRLPKAVRR